MKRLLGVVLAALTGFAALAQAKLDLYYNGNDGTHVELQSMPDGFLEIPCSQWNHPTKGAWHLNGAILGRLKDSVSIEPTFIGGPVGMALEKRCGSAN
jgi:hypothetical protein